MEPPIGLYEKIIKRIRKEERVLILRRVILFSTTLILSLAAIFPSLSLLASDFNNSGFFKFFFLMFSDFSSVMTYWKSFSMILLETLPTVSLALFLAVVLTFLQSIKSLTKDVKKVIKATA